MAADRLRIWMSLVCLSLAVGLVCGDEPAGPPLTAEGPSSSAQVADNTFEPPPAAPAPFGLLSGLYFSGEYVRIQPLRQALDIAIVVPNRADPQVGMIESLQWNATNGFRFGAGYHLPGDGWDVGLTYTYFHAPNNRQFYAPPGGTVLATLQQTGSTQVGMADGDTDLNYSVIDLDVSKSLFFGNAFGLRLFGGGRFAQIDQGFKCVYTGGALGSASDYVESPVNFTGAGLTGGGEGTWRFYGNWGLYGKARLSLLSGQFKNQLVEWTGGPTAVVNVCETYDMIVPVAELGAGLSFEGKHVFFKVGYELADWFNMVNSPTFSSTAGPGFLGRRQSDLTLEALSMKLGFLF